MTRAVTRARGAILSVALIYAVSVAIGLLLAHTGDNRFGPFSSTGART